VRLKAETRWVVCLMAAIVTVAGAERGGPAGAVATMGHEEPKIDPPPTAADRTSSNPMSGDAGAIAEGRGLYVKFCAPCHGPHADGESRFGKYAADLRKFSLGYKEFVVTVKNGRTGRQMPPWKEYLTEQQISQIGAYLETLAVEGAYWK
jgi:mono/diheme cytochrome c family protein